MESYSPTQTVEPLVQHLGALAHTSDLAEITAFAPDSPILFKYTKARAAEMVRDILSPSHYNGQSVIVCWSHKQIVQLAAMLGVARDQLPEKWKGKRFDVTWVLHRGSHTLC